MPLPDNITTIQVKGKYLDIFGNPIIGKVSFSIQPVLVDAGAEVVIIPRTVEAALADDGSFTAVLPATNDPDVSPTNFTIQVVEQFEGGGGGSFSITLPENTPQPIDITKFSRGGTPPDSGTVTYATQAALNAEMSARQQGDNEILSKIPEYVNVKGFPYYAKGDVTTDDTNAIQTALYSAPEGGIVFMPPGKYGTLAPIIVPPHVTLMGTHANGEQLPNDTAPRSCIYPLPGFVGDAVIKINDKLTAGYTDESREQRLYDITIDGSRVPAGTLVDGVKVYGYVQSFNMRDVCIWKVTGNGVICLVNGSVTSGSQAPLAMKWERVIAYEVGSTGFIMFNATDCTFTDVLALGCNADGWYIEGPANSTFQNCRSEWASGEGFKVQPKFGPVTFDGCSTDRNDKNGISIVGGDWDSSVLITSARLNRDGRNGGAGGGDYSGLRVDTNCPVLVDGIMVNARRDDNTTGPLGPDYAVSVINSQELILHSGYLNAKLGGINDLGGNSTVLRGPNVEEKIGDMIGAAQVRKRGVRSDLNTVKFFDNAGVEYDLLKPSTPLPTDQNIAAWSVDFALPSAGSSLAAGLIYLNKVTLRGPRTISKLVHHIYTAGAGLTAGQCFVGLYNMAGTRLGQSADMAADWQSIGYKEPAIVGGPLQLDAGDYYFALVANGTTPPLAARVGSGAGTLLNAGTTAATRRAASWGTGQTTLPATLTLGSTTNSSILFAVGLV